jgi:lipopolysaccharide biosynthesis glycosyltransferase
MNNCIFITFNNDYLQYAKSCLNSIKKNYPNHPVILVLYDGNDASILEFLKSFDNLQILDHAFDFSQTNELTLGVVGSQMVYVRYLLWTSLFDDYENVLHLDVDTIVLKPLDELFGTNNFFAVRDNCNEKVFSSKDLDDERLRALLKEDGIELSDIDASMLNAGVFVIPKKYRNETYLQQLWNVTRRYNTYLNYADQSAITIWCYINKINISTQYAYNFRIHLLFTNILQSFPLESIKVLHYAFWKPTSPQFKRLCAAARLVIQASEYTEKYS